MKPSHRRPLVVAALVVVIAVLASSCVLSGTWTALAPPNPAPPGTDAELLDVSCPTRDFCMAIGAVWSADPGVPVVQTWDGTTWTPLAFEPYAFDGPIEVTSVSCGTPTACAIGWTVLELTDQPPTFSVWDGSTWTQPAWPTVHDPFSAEVACAPDGSCLLATDQSPTVVWDGDTFTEFTFVDQVGGVLTPGLVDLSCVAIDDCVGITADGDHTVRWDGATWSDDPWWGVALPGVPGPVTYESISCTATDRCMVVGQTDDFSNPVPIAAVGDGTTWTAAEVPVTTGSLRDVSCVNAAACVAVGTIRIAGMGNRPPVAVGWNGQTWYRLPDPPTPPGATYAAIGCGVGDRCVTVGSAYPAGASVPLASAYDWRPPS